MAENGRTMEEIQQFLAHSDINVTRKIYARFSPDYLKEAAEALEIDDLGTLYRRALPKADRAPLKSLENMMGATGIEPVTLPCQGHQTHGFHSKINQKTPPKGMIKARTGANEYGICD